MRNEKIIIKNRYRDKTKYYIYRRKNLIQYGHVRRADELELRRGVHWAEGNKKGLDDFGNSFQWCNKKYSNLMAL